MYAIGFGCQWAHVQKILSVLLSLCVDLDLWSVVSPTKWPVTYGFDVVFDVSLNKLLKQAVDVLVIWDAMMLMWRQCNDTDKVINRSYLAVNY